MLQLLSCIIILSVLLLSDLHSAWAHKLRQRVGVVFYPLQVVIDSPIRFANWLAGSLRSQHELLVDNANLRADEQMLNARLQKLLNIKHENAELHTLLSARSRLEQKVLVANLLAINSGRYQRSLILDRGLSGGAKVGQPVLDAYGVCGQVVDVSQQAAKVLLLTDSRSSIPVEDYRSGVRAVANGAGGALHLFAVPMTADVRVGDLFVASGLGLRFPSGYPVGVVSDRSQQAGDKFATIDLHMSAHLQRSQQYLLVESNKSQQTNQARALLQAALPLAGGASAN